MKWIGRILKWIGGATVLLVCLLVYAALTVEETLPERMVVEIDLRGGVTEYSGDHPLDVLRGDRTSLIEMVEAIQSAGWD